MSSSTAQQMSASPSPGECRLQVANMIIRLMQGLFIGAFIGYCMYCFVLVFGVLLLRVFCFFCSVLFCFVLFCFVLFYSLFIL